MAAVAGVRSALNPNAPAFIPVALRRVEEFSPEWWNLVQTSPWYRDYWLSEHQESFNADRDENEEEDVLDLLPDSIDFGFDSETGGFDAAFDEFVAESEDSDKKEAEVKVEAKALFRNLSLPKEKSPGSFTITTKFDGGKTAKFVGPQPRALRRIQQPR